ncbi:DUF86 domain-containing protein [uncultured Duncaniella sp.]|uniref:HepT-like ribonuclease domain-containing protein n=2 Tax=uncultured Duncaniella sp. TaxID=2768039 RepID=UPI0026754A5A|nr:HepT-like ribonuclease domain-containing protein [uncultured Duncaniella sp.]MCI9172551.1 DUF86 domain-containing protein [Muribaculaceae bacterium]
MREAIRDRERLIHMLAAINRIDASLSRWGKDMFLQDKTFFFGLVKNVEIIGEATYKLTKDFKQSHQELPWSYIEKMRHILVHGYYMIEESFIWETIESDLPGIKPIIEKYISELEKYPPDSSSII